MRIKRIGEGLVVVLVLTGTHTASHAIDSASVEYATGNRTEIARVGLQWEWQRQWRKVNGRHIGGYWDLTAAQWRQNRHQDIPDNTRNIVVIGFTPVFRWQK